MLRHMGREPLMIQASEGRSDGGPKEEQTTQKCCEAAPVK
jgi:hypothetical protein